jgi:hypothetical protein
MRNIGKRFFLTVLPQVPHANFCSAQQSWQHLLLQTQYAEYPEVARQVRSTAVGLLSRGQAMARGPVACMSGRGLSHACRGQGL